PPVCEPRAPRHMPQASAAAEPLLEPPGVRSAFQGLRVGGGSKLAYCVVTVLPRKTAPACRSRLTAGAAWLAAAWGPRRPAAAGGGRPVEDVEDVLDGDREAVQRPAPLAAAQLVGQAFGLGAGVVAVDEHPGADALLAAVDALQAPFDEVGGRERSLADGLGG